MVGLLILLIVLMPMFGEAACSGSGISFTCSPPTTVVQINTALNNASDGATLTFTPGSYSWSTPINLVNGKGVSFVGTPGSTNVTVSGSAGFFGEGLTVSKPYRISGFNFTGTVSGHFMQIYPVAGLTLSNIRIDHNVFANTVSGGGNMVIRFGEHSPDAGNVTGVIDHNTFSGPGPRIGVYQLGPDSSVAWGASNQGTANNIFIEDNLFTFTTKDDVGMGCIDGWQKASMVFRFNTVVNCQLVAHEMGHEGGFVNLELYGNSLSVTSGIFPNGGRLVYDQGGGERMYFGNLLHSVSLPHDPDAIEVTHYRSCPNADTGSGLSPSCTGTAAYDGNRAPSSTFHGYPCWGQPGRKSAGVFGGASQPGLLSPMYSWLNRWDDTGALANISVTNPWGCSSFSPVVHVVANRDYYNAVSMTANTCTLPPGGGTCSPFDGTTGMGYGQLQHRPSTCTTNANESGGGVGYWATDQGTWNQSSSNPQGVQQNGADGVLYRCSATNTWTVAYTPYTYPHPLQGGTDTTPPAAPTGVTITQAVP